MTIRFFRSICIGLLLANPLRPDCAADSSPVGPSLLERQFADPPNSAFPGVYWYFQDGNRDPAGISADLRSMAEVGIGSALMLEVDLGLRKGPVKFMSEAWQDMFVQTEKEAERLGIQLTLGAGPGWCGSGGPWVTGEESMQDLVETAVRVRGPVQFHSRLAVPAPPTPYFNNLTPDLARRRLEYYADVAVLAFPTPSANLGIADLDEKALYYRAPYTSVAGVKPYLEPPAAPAPNAPAGIPKAQIIDLSKRLEADGTFDWAVPAGNWTIMRFGARNNGTTTRPAPQAGYGFETDKFSLAALKAHFANYADKLLQKLGPRPAAAAGWTMMHLDSWEMGAQNWTPRFRAEFERRRGYDPLPFYPAYAGEVVVDAATTERFLWDLRQTAQELLVENYAGGLSEYAHRHGFGLSIEPYDMNPAADLTLGTVADLPMGEFWANTYDSSFSCIEAASIGHTMGRPIVGAESFTSVDPLKLYPAAIKNQLDWAFGTGINRIVFHTFQHQPLGPDAQPGMTFSLYGANWNRNQTWWPMVSEVHRYIARCSQVLRQGVSVADILYLAPEGAPQVFRAPSSALTGEAANLPDRRGYNFDGCSPATLMARAFVADGRVAFPGGSSYRLLVLPSCETMTPGLLTKLLSLVKKGATLVGPPPQRSPSLSGFPGCDTAVRSLSGRLWGAEFAPAERTERNYGRGRVIWGGDLRVELTTPLGELYPSYRATARLLRELRVPEDFSANGPVRYTHRRTPERNLYFVANRSGGQITADCSFRVDKARPQLWDPLTGKIRELAVDQRRGGVVTVPLQFAPYQSFFVIFPRGVQGAAPLRAGAELNLTATQSLQVLDGPWSVAFPPGRGAPEEITFERLEDWTLRPESGIRYFSGIATYRKTFDLARVPSASFAAGTLFLDLGVVDDICRVRLNGKDLGVIWTAPWRVDIGPAVKAAGNELEIEVANRWPNRLIGDEQPADVDARRLSWKSGLLGGQEFKAGRYTFITKKTYTAKSELLSSGLLGPVSLQGAPSSR